MRDLLSNKYLTLLFRVILGVVFCYAAVDKIVHIDQFARAIYFYHIAPGWTVNAMAVVMPMVEMIAGICLILGIMPKGAATLIVAMLVMFIVALTIVYVRGVDINCGCFSVSSRGKESAVGLIWRDLLLLLMGLQVLFLGRDFLSLQRLRK